MSQSSPVLILIFNRPDKVRRLVASLAKIQPKELYVAADGPRAHVPQDKDLCKEARAIAQAIPWECTVHTHFSDKNLGVDTAVEFGITWFFEHVSEGVILEDDCIPHSDFFTFTSDMLEKYRDTPEIMMVSGDNFQNGITRGDGSYYFSHYSNTWGWATWKRAWDLYDTNLRDLPVFIKQNVIARVRPHLDEQRYWLRYFARSTSDRHLPWDAKWFFTLWNNGGISVVPNTNLVENIGFGKDATHTAHDNSLGIPAGTFPPPYTAPKNTEPHDEADRYIFERIYKVTLWKRIRHLYTMVF